MKKKFFLINQRGNLLLYYLLILAVMFVLAMLILWIVPESRIIMGLILAFSIFMTVRGSIGDGMPAILISALLIYFLVFKYFYVASGLFVVNMIIAYSGASIVSWMARFLFWKGE